MRSTFSIIHFIQCFTLVGLFSFQPPNAVAVPAYTTVDRNQPSARRSENVSHFRPVLGQLGGPERNRNEIRERSRANRGGDSNDREVSALVKQYESRGRNSLNDMAREFLLKNPEVKYLGKPEWGGSDIRDKETGRPLPGYVDPSLVKGAGPLGTVFPPTAAHAMGWGTESKVTEGMYYQMLSGLDGFNGWENSDLKEFSQKIQSGNLVAKTVQYPLNAADETRAEFTAQLTALGNAAGDVAKEQASAAIEYCAKYMENFTAQPGSKWNQIRESLFVPIGLLLLLPGAILSQIRATVGAGVPLSLTQSNPFDGILRAVIAIFLIPSTYLVVNYSIDFSNSITFTLASEYSRMFSSNVYQDAVCSEIRAFPVRGPKENQNAGIAQTWPQSESTSIPRLEQNLYKSKTDDPCSNTYSAPDNRTDEGMPLASVFGRLLAFGGNALLTSAWNVLCAFQLAYMLYLFWVGPVVAGLWVWPVKQFRDALPNWIEGVITLAFWSLFWNTAILLMACFKGMGDTGTVYETALNFLATGSVKYAFDFVGLIKAAGQESAKTSGVAGSSGHPGDAGESAPASSSSSSTGDRRSTPAPATPRVAPPSKILAPLTTSKPRNETLTRPTHVPEDLPEGEEAIEIDGPPTESQEKSTLVQKGENQDYRSYSVPLQVSEESMPIAALDASEFEPPPGETKSSVPGKAAQFQEGVAMVPLEHSGFEEDKAIVPRERIEVDHFQGIGQGNSIFTQVPHTLGEIEWIDLMSDLSNFEPQDQLDSAMETPLIPADNDHILAACEGRNPECFPVEIQPSSAKKHEVGRLFRALGRAANADQYRASRFAASNDRSFW
jgi:hypothetical protein